MNELEILISVLKGKLLVHETLCMIGLADTDEALSDAQRLKKIPGLPDSDYQRADRVISLVSCHQDESRVL